MGLLSSDFVAFQSCLHRHRVGGGKRIAQVFVLNRPNTVTNEIAFLDLRATYLEIKDELDAAYQRVMSSGWYILGEEVSSFEKEFAEYCGTRHCIGVGNGLEALQLILRAYGIGANDEVIVPANTYIATWLAVTYAGAIRVPIEPDMRTYNLDP